MSKSLSLLLTNLRRSVYDLLEMYQDGELHVLLQYSKNVHTNVLKFLKERPRNLDEPQKNTLKTIIELLTICSRQLKLFNNTFIEDLEKKGLEIIEYDIMCLSSF